MGEGVSMERLTIRNWRNLDPWEMCGQDNYCKRGCHDQGGCTKGCIVPRIYGRLAAYEDSGMEPQDIISAVDMAKIACALHELNAYKDIGPIDHIRDLLHAEQDGRLVVLPCNVGDTVYEPNKRGFISIYKVISIHLSTCSILVGWELIDGIYSNVNGFEASALGKTVFLTREKAEAALKGGEGL